VDDASFATHILGIGGVLKSQAKSVLHPKKHFQLFFDVKAPKKEFKNLSNLVYTFK
jgi:hypothetical protein